MTAQRQVQAVASREGRWWVVTVPGVGVTQTRHLDEVDAMVKDLVNALEGVGPGRVTVDVVVQLEDGLDVELRETKQAVAAAAQAQLEAGRRQRALATRLRGLGLSVKEVAALLGVSAGRISQLARGAGLTGPGELRPASRAGIQDAVTSADPVQAVTVSRVPTARGVKDR